MIGWLVRFRSRLSDEEVQTMFEKRADRYRRVPGLVEKIYLHFQETGEYGALYVWESREAVQRFRDSDLARTIPQAYRIEESARFELADVRLVVQPERVGDRR